MSEPAPDLGTVIIELFGVPSLRAGRRRVVVFAGTLEEAIHSLANECPGLIDQVVASGRLMPAYRVSLNGLRFITDPATPLVPGDSLVLVAADAGG